MNCCGKAISSAQCRAARALLNWSREDLAEFSKVSRAAIADFETEKRQVRERTVDDLQRVFEDVGLEFIFDKDWNGGGAGVRYALAEWTPQKWVEFQNVISVYNAKKSAEAGRDEA